MKQNPFSHIDEQATFFNSYEIDGGKVTVYVNKTNLKNVSDSFCKGYAEALKGINHD